jgi:hypothetical protein
MPKLVCPLCGEMQSPDGPGVGSRRDEDVPEKEWESYWDPDIFRRSSQRSYGGDDHITAPCE